MADALVSALLQVILGNLSSQLLQQFGLATGLNPQLEKLESVLSTIQAVLQDAEKRQQREVSVRNWLAKLKDAAYDAEDLLDEFATEALSRRSQIPISFTKRVRNFLSLRDNPLVFRLKIARELKSVLERLDAIADERSKFHLTEGVRNVEIVDDSERRCSRSSFVIESEIYGRDDEKEKIIQLLLSNQEDVSVYVIFGMGGIGKTTLAQLTYNDERIKKHYESRIWVCVPQDLEIITVTRAIIESASGHVSGVSELDPLQCRLHEILNGKRYILVLDDVWNEDQEKWDRLRSVLRCGAKGSSIIVTTRIKRVAMNMARLPSHRHHLGGLSKDDCWSLFKERAFGVDSNEDPKLVVIGKEIMNKCGGVPLAIKALGGLLHFKSTAFEWLSVKASEIWDLPGDGNGILPSLRLSYNHLPSYLKQCFAYCCIFPKDHWIKKETLIHLWMANGFVPLKGRMELEAIGGEIFNDLLWRSFFQEPIKNELGDIIECKMHDLMHDLAQSIMVNEYIVMEPNKIQEVSKRTRHLSCKVDHSMTSPFNNVNKVPPLRTLLISADGVVNKDFSSNILKRNCLQLRALKCLIGCELPSFLGKCKHLRYLDLSLSKIEVLPESILQNLQTLILNGCECLCELPKGMRHMSSLTNLDIGGCSSLTHMPIRMGQLTSLQVLSKFIAGKDSGYQIGELKDLNLKGEIQITNLDVVRNLIDAKTANLVGKQRLDSLILAWGANENARLQSNVEEVLEGLQPPPNLKKLVIRRYQGSIFPHWISDVMLPNLIDITLAGCERNEHLPPLGELSLLKHLNISGLNVKYLSDKLDKDNVVATFPSLEKLRVLYMPNLEGLARMEGRVIFPCLKSLIISRCNKLTTLPYLSSFRRLLISYCNSLMPMPKFPKLEDLTINNSNVTLTEDGLQGSPSLRSLVILSSPKLTSLTEGMQYLTSLERLCIENCPELTCLPESMQNLVSITKLIIYDCPNLISLPEGLRVLTTLKYLSISCCPYLEQSCQKEIGEDWSKIAHVPDIFIGRRSYIIH